jgi:hypothetical protein
MSWLFGKRKAAFKPVEPVVAPVEPVRPVKQQEGYWQQDYIPGEDGQYGRTPTPDKPIPCRFTWRGPEPLDGAPRPPPPYTEECKRIIAEEEELAAFRLEKWKANAPKRAAQKAVRNEQSKKDAEGVKERCYASCNQRYEEEMKEIEKSTSGGGKKTKKNRKRKNKKRKTYRN